MKTCSSGCAYLLGLGLILLATSPVSSQAPAEVKGENVKLVVYGKGKQVGGAFTQSGNKTWVEDTSDGRHEFTETARDEWSVYLQHKDYDIQLDLFQKKVLIKENNKPQRDLYTVLKAF